jgi:hypothetical protein
MHNRFALTPITAALLVALAGAGSAFADPSIHEEVSVSPEHQIAPQDETTMSTAANKVLRHIAEARSDLQGDKPDAESAKTQLSQAEKLLDIIQATLPSSQVKDHIWVPGKDLDYKDTREIKPDVVPIYASIEELVDYMPTAKAKAKLDHAKQAMEKGAEQATDKGDKQASSGQMQTVDDALLYVEADLPLNGTRQLVAEAKTHLQKGDVQAADQALASAEDGVLVVSASIQSPLTQAKAALWRAREDYSQGEQDFAKADLSEAVKYLERAAQSPDKVARTAAAALVSEVRDIDGTLQAGDTDLTSRLEVTWQRAEALSERSAEHISTGWQRLRAEGPAKQDLIEAKLQLAYARIDHLYSKDDAAAKVDLAEAKGYLDSAAGEVGPNRKAQLDAVSNLVNGLEQALSQGGGKAGNAKDFHRAEMRLEALIRQS